MKWSIVGVSALIAISSGVALSGCSTIAAARVSTFAYVNGELCATLPAPLDDAYRASSTALEELELPVIGWAKDAFGARLTAIQAQGGDVHVVLERKGDQATRIRIRVGSFGDQVKARYILRTIADNL
jgi:hypothetical protein